MYPLRLETEAKTSLTVQMALLAVRVTFTPDILAPNHSFKSFKQAGEEPLSLAQEHALKDYYPYDSHAYHLQPDR